MRTLNLFLKNKKFENFISLGYFCSIAEDLEIFGLRNSSMPFDWVISDFQSNLNLIQNNFDELFNFDFFYQSKTNRHIYKNIRYNFHFYHDFNSYQSLVSQINNVEIKYKRRIKQFYSLIIKPTLFIRYVDTENGLSELDYILKNQTKIMTTIKEYHPKNEIIYIINDEYNNNLPINFYSVRKDSNDKVSRHPLISNKLFKDYFEQTYFPNRLINIKFYKSKLSMKRSLGFTMTRFVKKFLNLFKVKVIHSKQF